MKTLKQKRSRLSVTVDVTAIMAISTLLYSPITLAREKKLLNSEWKFTTGDYPAIHKTDIEIPNGKKSIYRMMPAFMVPMLRFVKRNATKRLSPMGTSDGIGNSSN